MARRKLRPIGTDAADEPETVVRSEFGIEAAVASMITRVVRGIGWAGRA